MVNETGIIKKEMREIKKRLRNKTFNYLNQYLSVNLLISMFQNNKVINGELVFDFNNIEDSYDFYKKFNTKIEFVKSTNNKNLIFLKEINDIILEQFESLNNSLKSSSIEDVRKQENDTVNIVNLNESESGIFKPNKTLGLINIQTLINKYDNFSFKLNDDILLSKDEDFNFDNIERVKKFRINIKNKVFSSEKVEKLVSRFLYTCPRCFTKIYKYPNETYTRIKHGCEDFIGANGNQKFTDIHKENRAACISKQIYLYEFTIDDEKTYRYAYSFKSDIIPGRYIVDIMLTVDSLTADTKKNLAFIIGMKKDEIKLQKDLVTSNDAKKWCKEKVLPYVRFLDTLFSIRNLHYNYCNHKISDKGMLNQLFVTISGLAKLFFKYRCFGISVIGNTSLSKTYTGHMFALPLDRYYEFIQNGTDVSIPGLKGGINNTKEINGQTTSVFEEGVFTRGGLTVFDEGNNFYTDSLLNSSLKDLFNTEINIKKIGGKDGIKQNYTPIIYSNKSITQTEYTNYISNTYIILINQAGAVIPHSKTDRKEIERYLSEINLFLPLSYYIDVENNELLAKTISHVRESLKSKDVEWRTGGSIPANYRLLFDVVCFNKEETFEKSNKRVMERTEVILPKIYDIPFEEFQYALVNHYNIKNIDLYRMNNNSVEVNERLNKLFDNINEFLLNDGVDIHIHLSNNCKRMDEKIGNLVSTFIAVLQLLEDSNSVELSDNVKKWSKLILLKCKRGIIEDEYNFKNHKNYRFIRYDLSETIGDVKTMKQDIELSKVIKRLSEESNKGVDVKLDYNVEDEVE